MSERLILGSPVLRYAFQNRAIGIIEKTTGEQLLSAYTITGQLYDRLVLPLLRRVQRESRNRKK